MTPPIISLWSLIELLASLSPPHRRLVLLPKLLLPLIPVEFVPFGSSVGPWISESSTSFRTSRPPGTGKTRTAEIILLLLIELDPKVLLIAGSNKGINNLADAVIAAPSNLLTAGVVCDQLDEIMENHTIQKNYNAAMSTAWEGLMSQLLYRPELDRVLLTYNFVLSV